MKEQEMHLNESADCNEKMRAGDKETNQDELKVIPTTEELGPDVGFNEKRVGVYIRSATFSSRRGNILRLKKKHYQDVVSSHSGWNLVKIYADIGCSCAFQEHCDEFTRMIKDCEKGKLDIIITESVTSFPKDLLDCDFLVRRLATSPNPVGVLFETENLYTLDRNGLAALSFISALGQEDAHI